jgi:hypothetical protein
VGCGGFWGGHWEILVGAGELQSVLVVSGAVLMGSGAF